MLPVDQAGDMEESRRRTDSFAKPAFRPGGVLLFGYLRKLKVYKSPESINMIKALSNVFPFLPAANEEEVFHPV